MSRKHKKSYTQPAPTRRVSSGPEAGRAPAKFGKYLLLAVFWSYVLIPLAWGVSATVQKALLLFGK